MKKPVVEEIADLAKALKAAEFGRFDAPETVALIGQVDTTLPLETRLQAFTVALLKNLADNVNNNHMQILASFEFAKYMVFFGGGITQDLPFWMTERNDDVEQNNFLFVRAQQGVDRLVNALPEEQSIGFARSQKTLLDEYNRRNARMVVGEMLYEAHERPPIAPERAEEALLALRSSQKTLALQDMNQLIDRGLLSLKRAFFLRASILPLHQKPDLSVIDQMIDPDTLSCVRDIDMTIKDGQDSVDRADTILRYHAMRHSAFPRRLDEAKNKHQPS